MQTNPAVEQRRSIDAISFVATGSLWWCCRLALDTYCTPHLQWVRRWSPTCAGWGLWTLVRLHTVGGTHPACRRRGQCDESWSIWSFRWSAKGGATVLKVGRQFRERKKILTHHLLPHWGDMKQNIARFIIVIMTSKRLPAPNEIT